MSQVWVPLLRSQHHLLMGREGSCDSKGWIPSPFCMEKLDAERLCREEKGIPLKPLSHKEDREMTAVDSRGIETYSSNTF